MANISHTGSVCIDCVMAIANADTSGIDDVGTWAALVENTDATEDGKYTVVVDCDGEPYFSYWPCDYCGSSLGGDRHAVTFLEN